MGRYSLSTAEIDLYSIRLCVQSGLASGGWNFPVKLANNGWPVGSEIKPPIVYIGFDESAVAGVELGSNGKRRNVVIEVYASNDPMRYSVAEDIINLFRDGKVAPLAFVTGSESSPAADGVYNVDTVRWRSVPVPASAADVDKWRAKVFATIRRSE